MSRSYKAAYCTDNNDSHSSKKKAARVHRHGENQMLRQAHELYVEQPSKAYTNPYDICDFKFPAGNDGWPIRGKNAIRK
jgi:hypothetical protein